VVDFFKGTVVQGGLCRVTTPGAEPRSIVELPRADVRMSRCWEFVAETRSRRDDIVVKSSKKNTDLQVYWTLKKV
jgi:hypothetical protein